MPAGVPAGPAAQRLLPRQAEGMALLRAGGSGGAVEWTLHPNVGPPTSCQVLKILQHTCTQGSPQFLLQLRRNAAFIREAAGNGVRSRAGSREGLCVGAPMALWNSLVQLLPWTRPGSAPACPSSCLAAFTGPPDPLHGNSLNQKVRAAAQVSAGPVTSVPGHCSGGWSSSHSLCLVLLSSLSSISLSWQDLASFLFSDALLPAVTTLPARPLPPAGKCRLCCTPSSSALLWSGPLLLLAGALGLMSHSSACYRLRVLCWTENCTQVNRDTGCYKCSLQVLWLLSPPCRSRGSAVLSWGGTAVRGDPKCLCSF